MGQLAGDSLDRIGVSVRPQAGSDPPINPSALATHGVTSPASFNASPAIR